MSVPKIIGQCIYCGTKEPPLGREHVIPLALNGTLILHEASCGRCAAKTGKIEETVLGTMFDVYRSAANIRSRRPKDRPTSHSLFVKPAGADEFEIKVKTAEYPITMGLPILPYARYLLRLLDTEGELPVRWLYSADEDKATALARKLKLTEVKFSSEKFNLSPFVQMLAKIGHGFAVDRYGVDGFKQLAVEHALGHKSSLNYITGSPRDREVPPAHEGGGLHLSRFTTFRPRPELIVLEIRLFANLGAPIYHVVVGIKKDSFKRRFVQFALRVRKLIPRPPISRIKGLYFRIKTARKRRKRSRGRNRRG